MSCPRRVIFGLLLAVALALSGSAQAIPLLTDAEHWADAAGYWNNHFGGNWQIWFTRDDVGDPAPTFVNLPALHTPIPLSFGDNLFVMYKENHVFPNHDHGTRFTFANGSATGSLTVLMSPTDYLSSSTIPAASVAEIQLAGLRFDVTSYGWMRADVYSRDLVSPNHPSPSGHFDDIGVVNIRVVPEPGTLGLLALGALGLLRRRRRAH